MRGTRPLVFMLLVALAPLTAAAQGPPGVEYGSRKVDLSVGETTEVRGKVPVDLSGWWLSSEGHEHSRGKTYSTLQLYRASRNAKGELTLNLVAFQPPDGVQKQLLAAQREQRPWSPSKDDVAAIAAAVKAKPPSIDAKLRAKHIVSAAPEFGPEVKAAKQSKGAILAIQSLFQPYDRPLYGESYYVTKASPQELSGEFTMGAVPQDPVGAPIPFGTSGKFRWIHLDVPLE